MHTFGAKGTLEPPTSQSHALPAPENPNVPSEILPGDPSVEPPMEAPVSPMPVDDLPDHVTPEMAAQVKPKTFTGSEDQDAHARVGMDIKLPVPVAIVDEDKATRPGLFINHVWIEFNIFFIGIYGTAASWYLAIASLASQHPQTAVVILSLLSVFSEEKFSTQPILTNTIKYVMTSYDPSAASTIFAVKPVDPDPIGNASRKILTDATTDYMKSAEYATLKTETEQDVQRQIRKQTYLAAGMKDDAADVDLEITAAREARKAAHKPADASAPAVAPIAGNIVPSP